MCVMMRVTTTCHTAAAKNCGAPRRVTPAEWVIALRPSRYCPWTSSRGSPPPSSTASCRAPSWSPAVADWVHRRLVYTSGASRPVDTAVDTLLPARASAGTTRTSPSPCCGRWRSRPAWSRSTRRGCPRWTSTRSSRPTSTARGASSTPPGSPRPARWCALLRPRRRRHRVPVAVRRRGPVRDDGGRGDDGGAAPAPDDAPFPLP